MLAVVMLPYWWGYRRERSWILFPQHLFSLPLHLLKTLTKRHKIKKGSCFCSACAIEFQYMAVDVCVERFCFKIRKIFRRATGQCQLRGLQVLWGCLGGWPPVTGSTLDRSGWSCCKLDHWANIGWHSGEIFSIKGICELQNPWTFTFLWCLESTFKPTSVTLSHSSILWKRKMNAGVVNG